jgi:hypothetical protein
MSGALALSSGERAAVALHDGAGKAEVVEAIVRVAREAGRGRVWCKARIIGKQRWSLEFRQIRRYRCTRREIADPELGKNSLDSA